MRPHVLPLGWRVITRTSAGVGAGLRNNIVFGWYAADSCVCGQFPLSPKSGVSRKGQTPLDYRRRLCIWFRQLLEMHAFLGLRGRSLGPCRRRRQARSDHPGEGLSYELEDAMTNLLTVGLRGLRGVDGGTVAPAARRAKGIHARFVLLAVVTCVAVLALGAASAQALPPRSGARARRRQPVTRPRSTTSPPRTSSPPALS